MTPLSSKTPRQRQPLQRLLRNLAGTGRTSKQLAAIAIDTGVVLLALWGALSARYNEPFTRFEDTWHLFVLLPLVNLLAFGALGIYRWVIRSSNHQLLQRIAAGCAASAFGLLVIQHLVPPGDIDPRSLFAIYGVFLVVGTAGLRLVWQGLFETGRSGAPVAIYGAGATGRQLAALISQTDERRAVLFIDDDPALRGRTIGGVPVVTTDDEEVLARRVRRSEATQVILAMPSIDRETYRERLARAERLGLPVQTLPATSELFDSRFRPDDIRDVSINDILGRAEVQPDMTLVERCVRGRTVLVTGGGGSIGSELCRQVYPLGPKKLVVLDQSEENLYEIVETLQALGKTLGGEPVPVLARLGSVTDSDLIDELFGNEAIDTVYHAAACKHVPIVEAQPDQGVRVNVFGTLNVVEHAIHHGVSDFILISSDKAVRPTSAMGATKRLAEMVLQAKALEHHRTRLSMVRFGNVLGSSGSVVPKFRKQIEAGGPVTLTSRRMTRFFMTIPEAAQLVLQAGAIATGGEVFVLDMGDPVRIEDLARTMIERSGRRVANDTGDADDIEIVETGIRPGEKLYEELFISESIHRRTPVPKIFTAAEPGLDWRTLSEALETMRPLRGARRETELRDRLFAAIDRAQEVPPARLPLPAPVGVAASAAAVTADTATMAFG